MYHHLTVDELESVQIILCTGGHLSFIKHLFLEGFVNSHLYLLRVLLHELNVFRQNHQVAAPHLRVEILGCFVEDITKGTVVYLLFIHLVGLADAFNMVIVELQLTAEIAVDVGGVEAFLGDGAELGDDRWRLFDGVWIQGSLFLTGLQRFPFDVQVTLYHELEHEPAHLARMTVFCGVVIEDSYILCPLDESVEIIRIYRHLMIDGGKTVGLADGVGDEAGIVHALGHVPLLTGEDEHMIEVEVPGFEYAHELNTSCRFSMERNRCTGNELVQHFLVGNEVDFKLVGGEDVLQTVQ